MVKDVLFFSLVEHGTVYSEGARVLPPNGNLVAGPRHDKVKV